MKRTINGERFDTDAKHTSLIGSHQFGSPGDSHYWKAGLYVTKRPGLSGRYFLAGSGGPMSAWRLTVGKDHYCGSERIFPLSRASALKWAQEYCPEDKVKEFFGTLLESQQPGTEHPDFPFSKA